MHMTVTVTAKISDQIRPGLAVYMYMYMDGSTVRTPSSVNVDGRDDI